MKILSLTYCNKSTGYGHWFRSLALAQVAQQHGHTVTIAGDRKPPNGLSFIHLHDLSPGALVMALQATKPDWLIVDLPGDLPEWIRELTKCRIAVLNGIGYNQADSSNLRIVQGMADIKLPGPQDNVPVLKGIEYVIIRPEMAKYRNEVKGQETLVWGGGMDVLGLHRRFFAACPGRLAVHIISDMIALPMINSPTQTCIRTKTDSGELFAWLAGSKDVVAAMGVIAWESAFYRLPQKIFSATPLHLIFAQGMERAGLLKAYPKVGLPETNEELRAFLDEDFEPWGEPPDVHGGARVLKALESF